MIDNLRRYGSRIWLRREQTNAISISTYKLSDDVKAYTFGCTVVLASKHASNYSIIKSLRALIKEIAIASSVDRDKLKEEKTQ